MHSRHVYYLSYSFSLNLAKMLDRHAFVALGKALAFLIQQQFVVMPDRDIKFQQFLKKPVQVTGIKQIFAAGNGSYSLQVII